jgi:hypothetical protein
MAKHKDLDEDDGSRGYTKPAPKEVPTATTTTGLPADAYLTEQEKGPADPVTPPVDPVPAEVLDIARTQPYPTADS